MRKWTVEDGDDCEHEGYVDEWLSLQCDGVEIAQVGRARYRYHVRHGDISEDDAEAFAKFIEAACNEKEARGVGIEGRFEIEIPRRPDESA